MPRYEWKRREDVETSLLSLKKRVRILGSAKCSMVGIQFYMGWGYIKRMMPFCLLLQSYMNCWTDKNKPADAPGSAQKKELRLMSIPLKDPTERQIVRGGETSAPGSFLAR